MRLRRKLTLAFFLVSALVSLVLALFLYRFTERSLTGELRARLRDVAYLGAHLVDRSAYERLRAAAAAGPDAAAVAAVEQSSDYRTVSDQLNVIRSAEPGLVRYAYLLMPTDDPQVAR